MKILDCTLRDGGYLTKWKWDESIVKKYLTVVDKYVDYVELGYRDPSKNGEEYCFCEDSHIRGIVPYNQNANNVIMIDLQKYCTNGVFDDELFYNNFGNIGHCFFKTIRIAINESEIKECMYAVDYIKSLGFNVFVSLMKISTIKDGGETRIKDIIEMPDKFFFADSFGSLDHIIPYTIVYRDSSQSHIQIGSGGLSWTLFDIRFDKIGFHLHNNSNNAMKLSLDIWNQPNRCITIDTTICGYGRGAGNVDLFEFLLKTKFDVRKPEEYLPLLELSLDFARYIGDDDEWLIYLKKYLYMINSMLNAHPDNVDLTFWMNSTCNDAINHLIEKSK